MIVLLGDGDPVRGTLDQVLVGYRAETDKLDVVDIDPDKDRADYLAVQEKYDLAGGATQDGRVLLDAALIVVHGERHQEIMPSDLVAYDAGDSNLVAPHVEQALTGAIRSVFESDKPVVCVTQGHGEHALDEGGQFGLAYFRERLTKNNYEVVPVFGEPTESDPLAHCNVIVLAAPQEKVPAAEVKAIATFIEGGGGALLVTNPLPNEGDPPWIDVGVGSVLALGGVGADDAIIFEGDPSTRLTSGHGENFLARFGTHPVTAGLEHEQGRGLGVVLQVAGPLHDLKNDVTPSPLITTSDKAFGLVNFQAFAATMTEPKKSDADLSGPLTVAFAAERAKLHASDPHGARIVAVASFSILFGRNWSESGFRGTSRFVESSISWIAAHRAFLDIPEKPASAIGVRLTQDSLDQILRYVVLVMPFTAAFFGMLVYLARRRAPKARVAKARSAD